MHATCTIFYRRTGVLASVTNTERLVALYFILIQRLSTSGPSQQNDNVHSKNISNISQHKHSSHAILISGNPIHNPTPQMCINTVLQEHHKTIKSLPDFAIQAVHRLVLDRRCATKKTIFFVFFFFSFVFLLIW